MQNQWLASLDAEDRARLAPHLRKKNFSRGHVLHEAGEIAEAVWFPMQGAISLLTLVDEDKAIETAVVGTEGLVGAACGPMNGTLMTRAVAQTDGRAVCIASNRFSDALAESETLRAATARHTEALFAQVQQLAACNAQHLLEERLARWILMLDDRVGGGRLNLTQQSIADMLAVRRATVSEVSSALERRGLIRRTRGALEVADRAGLERAACACYGAVRKAMDELDVTPGGPSA